VLSKMSSLDATRAELALLIIYLNKAEARDKICRAIQYGSKFLSNGQPGTAQNVDKSTSLARKVFRLLKVSLSMICMLSLALQLRELLFHSFYLERTGIYKNKERAELIGRISLFCWLGASTCTTLIELAEIGRLSTSIKKLEKELKKTDKIQHFSDLSNYDLLWLWQNEQYLAKVKKSNERTLSLVKASMDMVVAIGLLQLAPKKVTPRVTGAYGFLSSLISCYQLLPARPKGKSS
ncbi:hypothetical protein Taro_021969, partial [Colocasia esculenta]|nr:hypothetical protein [Colocasia esculenta]